MLALATAAACALAVSSPTPRLDAHAALAPVSVLRATTGERVPPTEGAINISEVCVYRRSVPQSTIVELSA